MQRKTNLYTWNSPGNRKRYKIGYLLEKVCFRNSTRDVKTLPGAHIELDHNIPVVEEKTKLESFKRTGKRKLKWNSEKSRV